MTGSANLDTIVIIFVVISHILGEGMFTCLINE